MKLRWTKPARQDLASIHKYIAFDSPRHADAQVDRILERTENICLFPLAGREVPEWKQPMVREVFEGNYRILYRMAAHEVVILRVIHFARNYRP